tara:strand:+ start:475 stop:1650 length:1176 start_codon:yes stop_codon:yes gene_type:complete
MNYKFKKEGIFDLIFFIILFLIIFFRAPCWLIEFPFKGFEFHAYKENVSKNFFENLLFIYPNTNAYMLWFNLTNSIASTFSFETAKIISKLSTVFVYLFIIIYIYYSKSLLLITKKSKIFTSLIILISPPMTAEVWMANEHLRGYFGILSFFLLFTNFKKQSSKFNNFSYFLIFFSGLCSIYSAALMPVFLIRFVLERNKECLLSFVTSFSSSIIQFIVIISDYKIIVSESVRFHFEASFFYSYAYNIIFKSFFGSQIPKILFVNSEIYLLKNFNLAVYILLSFFVLISIFYIIRKKDNLTYLMSISLLIISFLVFIGSVHPGHAGGRYGVLTGVILIFIIYRFFVIEKNNLLKNFFLVLLTFSILTGSIEYSFKNPTPEFLDCSNHNFKI